MLKAFDTGHKRILQCWHRRSGKDKVDLNLVAREMQANKGIYYYFYPTYSQGKKALWDNIGRDGIKYLDHFPKELIDGKPNETEMKIKYKNGSIFQVIGTDNIDNVVGTNPRGCVFSEYSLQNPKAWDYIRPILKENKGWAIFNFTPRGKNHGYDLYEMAIKNPKWFVQKLTINDTNVLTEEDIQEERDSGMTEDMIQQEYYCSFSGGVLGAYYWKEYNEAEKEGRFMNVAYDPAVPVHTVWDLGVSDAMSIGFYQVVGAEWHKIDYYDNNNVGLPHYIKLLQDKGYIYGKHFAPHDIKAKELTTGKTRLDTARTLGIDFEVVPSVSIQDGIDAGRRFFKKLWVDKIKCKEWLKLIPQYTKEYDDDKKIFKDNPQHDWTSHGADEYRYASLVAESMNNENDGAVLTKNDHHYKPGVIIKDGFVSEEDMAREEEPEKDWRYA